MKISIKSESYYNTPAPKLTKARMNLFWTNLWKLRLHYEVKEIETMDIRINQALPWSPWHFYITINGNKHFHISDESWRFERSYPYFRERPTWEWLVDLSGHRIKLGGAGIKFTEKKETLLSA